MNTEELKRLAEAATPGPWIWDGAFENVEYQNELGYKSYICHFGNQTGNLQNNGKYIAAADPQTVLGLIEEISELRQQLKSEGINVMRDRIEKLEKVAEAAKIIVEDREMVLATYYPLKKALEALDD